MSNLTITGPDLPMAVEGFLIPFVSTLGTLGNLAATFVLKDNRLDMKATFR